MEEQKKERPLMLTKIKLSKKAIDSLVLSSLDLQFLDQSNFVEYITSSGQKIMLPQSYISSRYK